MAFVLSIFSFWLVKLVLLLGFVLAPWVMFLIWLERKLIADIQARIGPNRVGPFGLLQPLADGIKLFFKEDVNPTMVDKTTFILAPAVSVACAVMVLAVLPWGTLARNGGTSITSLNVGLLYVFGLMSVSVYGVVLAGWSSNSKYSLLGSLRSSAQMISYELPLGMSVLGVIMLAGSLDLMQIVKAQHQMGLWYVFLQPVGFIIYVICAFAETSRLPFDLPDAETELVAGFHTEYSSMKFAMFFLGEYAFITAHSALATALFLGGWGGPSFIPMPGIVWFGMKMYAFVFFFMWVRGTLPRFRYDHLMSFGWKFLMPVALLNLFLTGAGIVGWEMYGPHAQAIQAVVAPRAPAAPLAPLSNGRLPVVLGVAGAPHSPVVPMAGAAARRPTIPAAL